MSNRSRTDLLVVHVSATPPEMDIGVEEIRRMHLARGWSDIGYQFVIRRNAEVEAGRGINSVGAHVKGYNSRSVGICVAGGIDADGRPEHNATPAQMKALETLLRELVKTYPGAKICGHRDLSPDRDGDGIIEPFEHLKACPCFDVIPWANSLGLPGADIRGVWARAANIDDPHAPDLVRSIQQALKDKGYHEVGTVDGKFGSKTRGAILAFEADHDLPVTGAPTGELLVAVLAAPTRHVAPERATGVPENSRIVDANNKNTVLGGAAAATGILGVGSKAVEQAEGGVELLQRGTSLLGPVWMLVVDFWPVILFAGGAGVIWWAVTGNKARIEDHRSGKTA